MTLPHPLCQLQETEILTAREVVLQAWPGDKIHFRSIYLHEPAKASLQSFLAAERTGNQDDTPRPPRMAFVQYDVLHADKKYKYVESTVDIASKMEFHREIVDSTNQAALTMEEMKWFYEVCMASPVFKEAVAKFKLPEGYQVEIDPWPYGGLNPEDPDTRYIQALCFAKDHRNGNLDSNHYSHPLPIIPIMDVREQKIVRIDKLPTGGTDDLLAYDTHSSSPVDHCRPSEYVPELLDSELRTDVKPLNITQPEGPSFKVSDGNLVEWQKWRFRVGFNPREGITIHDVYFDNRSIFYRLSLSEMTVPYGDPRPPFNRKQAFDFGDGGAGRAANNLSLGCDCLGAVQYLDYVSIDPSGKPSVSKNVICIHEQDNGIGWKHTNFRTERAVVTRSRELVVQFIITLANYEYIFAYKFDQAAALTLETRATGILSVVNIDPGKTSPWGNVVSPGALAQNHQHIFCVRIDPAIDGSKNSVFHEQTLPMSMDPEGNPCGNGYKVVSTPVKHTTGFDAQPANNLIVKISNGGVLNPISQKPVSYKFTPPPTQLILADPCSIVAKRAQFAQHHVWVTKFKDHQFFAAGNFTNQSRSERDGLYAAAVTQEDISNDEGCDIVLWSVFSFTHNPRVEDWPVMPVEKIELQFRPADFFDRNPALDVPGSRNTTSVRVVAEDCCKMKDLKV